FKGYFFLPPSAPVTPCVDSRKAYDSLAEAVERMYGLYRTHYIQSVKPL
ncbi:MAG: hypothetical protein HFJ97_07200, partial [Eubacterium sp.]|nr:hypothetical protein [Eubacterium sp.]